MPDGLMTHDDAGITRRGFVVLAASALGSLFLRPSPPEERGSTYLISVSSIGCGYGWDDWEAEASMVPEPSACERAREALCEGSILEFEHNPNATEKEPWLFATFEGEPVCDLPFRAVPEEISAAQKIYDAMRKGNGTVWGRVTSARHSTLSDYGRNERIHEVEFDVFVSA